MIPVFRNGIRMFFKSSQCCFSHYFFPVFVRIMYLCLCNFIFLMKIGSGDTGYKIINCRTVVHSKAINIFSYSGGCYTHCFISAIPNSYTNGISIHTGNYQYG